MSLLLCAPPLLPNEVGTNDVRISDMGPDGDANYDAEWSQIVYNSQENEYLVVWSGSDNSGALVSGEFEIWGQLLDASGNEIGSDFRISDMGPDGNANFDAQRPAVAYNSQDNEYLVVWHGDDNSGSLVDNELEVYGQRLDADGNAVGSNDFRISSAGPDGTASVDADFAKVAYNTTSNQYLVIWQAEDYDPVLTGHGQEIFGQLLSASGVASGAAFRISDMGPAEDTTFESFTPDVVYNAVSNEYLVVWMGDDASGSMIDGELEIYGQRLSAAGAEVGTNDFRISDMGPDGDATFEVSWPHVAHNTTLNQYLVIWSGDDNVGTLVNDETEVFGQLLNSAGAEIGTNDFRITNMGPDGSTTYHTEQNDVLYISDKNEYVVVFISDDDAAGQVNNEYETYLQRLTFSGGNAGSSLARLSDMGPDGTALYHTDNAAVAYNPATSQAMITWFGTDNSGTLVLNETEIFIQRFDLSAALVTSSGASSVTVFPNPYRLSQGHTLITFSNIPAGSRLRVFTASGELVRDLGAATLTSATWDAKNDSGQTLASGVYFVLIEGAGGSKTAKVVIQK